MKSPVAFTRFNGPTANGVQTISKLFRPSLPTNRERPCLYTDTARFTGDVFLEPWVGKPMKDVWDIASGTMPEDNPGSLKQQEYGDILAYFLSLNEFPTGDAELEGSANAMAAIAIEKKK